MITIKAFRSDVLNNTRDIKVYLPASYSEGSQEYPVLYLHDGQNVFAPGGPYGCWHIETTYDRLIEEGKLNEVILVAVNNNSNRIPEYTPTADPAHGGGNGQKYISFLTEEVIPWISTNFRVKTGSENTAILGSSLGGLISFYAALNCPDVFGMSACVSPSFWWNSQNLLTSFENSTGPEPKVRLWIDSGNAEGDDRDKNGVSSTVEDVIRAAAKLSELGYVYGEDLLLDVDIKAGHNESAWAARVHKPLLFFFGKEKKAVANKLEVISSSPEIDKSGTVPEILLFTRVWYENGISAFVLPQDILINSEQSDLFKVQDNGYISLQKDAVTADTNITFNVTYAGLTASTSVAVFQELSANVSLYIEIRAPVQAGDRIFMVGNNPAIGSWDPSKGYALSLQSSSEGTGVYTNTLVVPRNTSMEFKFCAGPAWDYEELNSSGYAVANRSTIVSSNASEFKGEVMRWKSVIK